MVNTKNIIWTSEATPEGKTSKMSIEGIGGTQSRDQSGNQGSNAGVGHS